MPYCFQRRQLHVPHEPQVRRQGDDVPCDVDLNSDNDEQVEATVRRLSPTMGSLMKEVCMQRGVQSTGDEAGKGAGTGERVG